MSKDISIKKKEYATLLAVSKKVGRAIVDFKMIEDGDKIAVAVSGGKDSLSLLHILKHRERVSPIRFEFVAVHIEFEFSDFDPKPLIKYFEDHDFKYIVRTVPGLKGEKWEEIDCYRYSALRRKALFELAKEEGFARIAFGHHLDDIVETILMNQFFRGEIAAMKPKQQLFGGEVDIIRPLSYVREDAMREVAKELAIDSMGQSKCAYDDTSRRMEIKKLVAHLENKYPSIVKNIFKSLQNVKQDYLIDVVENKSLKPKQKNKAAVHGSS